MDDLEVALDALESEAKEWAEAQTALYNALAIVNTLDLDPEAFSFIDKMTGISNSYDSAISHVREVLNNGIIEMAVIAEMLMKARKDFQSTDEAVAAEARKVWIPEY